MAIIVILAIIAVITVPIILNIIENSRKGAATDSAYGYKDAVQKYYVTELSKPNQEGLKLNGTYEVQSDGTLVPADGYSFGITNYNTLPVSVSGEKPTSGTLTYSNNVLTGGTLIIGDYRVTFNSDGTVTTTKNTSSSSNEQISQYTYGYLNIELGSINQLDSSWKNYLRKNTSVSTSPVEVCTKFSNGVICIEENRWDCEEFVDTGEKDEYNNTIYACSNLNSYVEQKRIEAESKGASCNYVYSGANFSGSNNVWHLMCSDGEGSFGIEPFGVDSYDEENCVWCQTSTYTCEVSS